jgi:hypothetical protein
MLLLTRIVPAVLLSVLVASAQQTQTGAIVGTVMDRSGGVLPGVTVKLAGPSVAKGITNARGEYRFDNLTPGEYRIEATLVGFRTGSATLTVSAGVATKSDVALRLGLLSIVDYVFPAGGVPAALREADVVAYIRLTRAVGVRVVNDAVIVTDHDVTVLSVVKADNPGIASGSSIRFAQDNSGRWAEDGYQAIGIERPYEPGESFVAFLMRHKDASLGEFRGAGYMWPVKQGFVIPLNPAGSLPPGLGPQMPLDECLTALRRLLTAKNP